MTDSQVPGNAYRSRYGIEKLQNHNYQNWSFQCRMLLSTKKVWKVVTGEHPRLPMIEQRELAFAEQALVKIEGLVADASTDEVVAKANKTRTTLTDSKRVKYQKEIDVWDERDEEALRIISFTVSDLLQAPIRYGKTSKGT